MTDKKLVAPKTAPELAQLVRARQELIRATARETGEPLKSGASDTTELVVDELIDAGLDISQMARWCVPDLGEVKIPRRRRPKSEKDLVITVISALVRSTEPSRLSSRD